MNPDAIADESISRQLLRRRLAQAREPLERDCELAAVSQANMQGICRACDFYGTRFDSNG